jgi:hypothetical protein
MNRRGAEVGRPEAPAAFFCFAHLARCAAAIFLARFGRHRESLPSRPDHNLSAPPGTVSLIDAPSPTQLLACSHDWFFPEPERNADR